MKLISCNTEDTKKLAGSIAKQISLGDNIALEGPLGSGKTYLIKSLLSALNYQGLVTSPTFTLINEYPITLAGKNITLFHADLYRLDEYEHTYELNLEEVLLNDDQIVIIEWANKFAQLKPRLNKSIVMKIIDSKSREIVLTGFDSSTKKEHGYIPSIFNSRFND